MAEQQNRSSNDGQSSEQHRPEEADDEITETDPSGRYYRYHDSVGKGRFKQVYKAFDTQMGIDVAWSKISADRNHLTDEQLEAVARDIQKGLDLDHPNIIKCFQCWEDQEKHCINLITELFTSGNLRQYRNLHKHLDPKAIKRMARQILKGLGYLHSVPVTHGDLRCDKIYVNGHSGEIKIGDLGLATLLPYRWTESESESIQQCTSRATYDASSDIFAFGLCMLELLTFKQLDQQHCSGLEEALQEVPDEGWRTFIAKCVSSELQPSAMELLDDPFLSIKKPAAPGEDLNSSLSASTKNLQEVAEKRRTDEPGDQPQEAAAPAAPIAVGKLRGEDYNFEFEGKVKAGKMHFRLVMTDATSSEQQNPQLKRTLDFVFDPEVDTADKLADEVAQLFSLSPTDTEICAAALREWLAREMPGSEGGK